MSTFSTVGSAKAFHVDEQGFAPEEVIPTALILQITTKVGFVPGDEPAIRVPFVNVDADAGFIAEAAEIPEGDPVTNEVLIHTGAVAQLEPISVDQYQQGNAAAMLSNAIRKAVIRKANRALLAQPAPTSPAVTPPEGIVTQATDGGTFDPAVGLDALIDAIAAIESDGGAASHIVAHPNAWARIAKAKKADNSNESLVGSGTEAAERRLQSLPVLVDRDVPESSLLVLDKEAILSGYGNVEFAVSDQHLFHRRSYAARCWFRFGAVVAHPERVVLLGVGDGS